MVSEKKYKSFDKNALIKKRMCGPFSISIFYFEIRRKYFELDKNLGEKIMTRKELKRIVYQHHNSGQKYKGKHIYYKLLIKHFPIT